MARAPLVIADQGFFWVGVEKVKAPYGTLMSGGMYVQYQIPAERKFPWPLILVHGGGGQGLDMLGTPDGRPGWAEFFVRRGWATYVVDRPALGRAPYHQDVYGPLAPPPTYEFMQKQFLVPERFGNYPQAKLHNQWPSSGDLDDPVFDQFMAGQAGSLADLALTHTQMQHCGSLLLAAAPARCSDALCCAHADASRRRRYRGCSYSGAEAANRHPAGARTLHGTAMRARCVNPGCCACSTGKPWGRCQIIGRRWSLASSLALAVLITMVARLLPTLQSRQAFADMRGYCRNVSLQSHRRLQTYVGASLIPQAGLVSAVPSDKASRDLCGCAASSQGLFLAERAGAGDLVGKPLSAA